MKISIDSLADYSGPGVFLTLATIWLYVGIKKKKFYLLRYMVYFPALFKDYREITIKKNGKVGILYYIFIILITITFLSIFSSALSTI
jgi:hypothetical protein